MSLAVRLFVIDYAFIHSSGKKRQQNFPPRSVFFWVLMVSWRVTGNMESAKKSGVKPPCALAPAFVVAA